MKKENSRRSFIRKSAILAIAGAGLRFTGNAEITGSIFSLDINPFTLPPLPYAPQDLEPHIDTLTMQIHHGKHHQAYVDNLNKAVKESKMEQSNIDILLANVSKYSVAIRNNGGGHYNHSMFWKLMKPNGGGEPSGAIAEGINSTFGSFASFKEKFNAAATSRFGSGWAWLIAKDGKLSIGSTPNQDNPLMDVSEIKGTPVLALDVWEHAYYLKYMNKRIDYVNAWWNLINWDEVNRLLKTAVK